MPDDSDVALSPDVMMGLGGIPPKPIDLGTSPIYLLGMDSDAPNRPNSVEEVFRATSEQARRRSLEGSERQLAMALATIAADPGNASAYINASRCAKRLGRLQHALALLESGVARCPTAPALHEYYIERLEKCNRTEQAIAIAGEAARIFPEQLIFRLREALLLPVLYESQDQVAIYRRRFSKGLESIITTTKLDTPSERLGALAAVGKSVNKYLAYQGQDDRDLQVRYGEWVHRILAASYPTLAQPLPMPPLSDGGSLRIGYLSARFRDMSATRAFLGWIQAHNRTRFNAFCYHVGQQIDTVTERVHGACKVFRQLSSSVERTARAVMADDLHLLVYLDLGMEPLMTQLAALRLAPIQCVAWDHPVTSGLPTIDYFISNVLMEPPGASRYYSERLVCLPGTGMYQSLPTHPSGLFTKSRADFGLRDDAIVYVSCQSVFKYLPNQDDIFARIASNIPQSQFVFLVTNELVREDFERRLNKAFSLWGLRGGDHCVFLPELPRSDFWSLLRCSDIYLDTIGWSGCISTLDAVVAGLPIVTMPGGLMRSRQSAAILTQLEAIDTIATNEDDYTDIALRLGIDRPWRQVVIDRTRLGQPKLYNDTSCVRSLEDFYDGVVRQHLNLKDRSPSGCT